MGDRPLSGVGMGRGVLLFAMLGAAVVVFGLVGGRGWTIVGGLVVLAGIGPLRLADRVDPQAIGRPYLGAHLQVLMWFLLAVACFALGFFLASR